MPVKSIESCLREGLSLHGAARWQAAVEFWQAALEEFPNQPLPRLYLGIALVNLNAFERAARHFDALQASFPNEPLAALGRGFLLEAQQKWDSAAQTYETLLRRFPHLPPAVAALAHVLVKTGYLYRARALLKDASLRHPGSAQIRSALEDYGQVKKADITNALVRQFGLKSLLEYNKPLGGLVLHDIDCAEKTLAYLPENRFEAKQDPRLVERARLAANAIKGHDFVVEQDLLGRFGDRRFDLIFYDPLHVRPEVDHALQQLPRLLNPDGFLVVHDCNPEHAALTSCMRNEEVWLGETYLAFANFHHHNPGRSITVAEDFGVGIIFNRDLVLDYPLEFELDYESFARDRRRHVGLVSHAEFSALLAAGDAVRLMEASLRP